MIRLSKRFIDFIDRTLTIDWQDPIGTITIDDEDLFNKNIGKRSDNLFLGYFSVKILHSVLDKYKITSKLNRMGFKNLKIEINTDDPYKHKLLLKNISDHKTEILVELVLKRDFIIVDMPFKTTLNGKKFEVLIVEWLKMQNPRATFSKNKPQLPGQDFPGLGIGSKAIELLVLAAHRLGLQAIVNIPDHYHNAFLYSKIFTYELPQDQARLASVIRDTKRLSVSETAWAIEEKALLDSNNNLPLEWTVSRQIFPLYKEWVYLYKSNRYKYEVYKNMKKFKFKVDNRWIKRRHNK